jgi:hypothetical protein
MHLAAFDASGSFLPFAADCTKVRFVPFVSVDTKGGLPPFAARANSAKDF